MTFSEKQIKQYIDLYCICRINDRWTNIAFCDGVDDSIDVYKIKKDYKTISAFAAKQIFGDINQTKKLNELKEEVKKSDKYQRIEKLFKNQYTSNKSRKEGFGSFKTFYNWYKEQGNRCYYCETDAKTLKELFDNRQLNSGKFNDTLHIERLEPKEPYSPNNCKLACSLCNNAKSDLISNENFKKYFSIGMKAFLSDLHGNKIENNTLKNVKE